MKPKAGQCNISFSRPESGTLQIRLEGECKIGSLLPSDNDVHKAIETGAPVSRISFDTRQLTGWDSRLLTFLIKIINLCSSRSIQSDKNGLPQGVQRLLALASAVPERQGARGESERLPFLEQTGEKALDFRSSSIDVLEIFHACQNWYSLRRSG